MTYLHPIPCGAGFPGRQQRRCAERGLPQAATAHAIGEHPLERCNPARRTARCWRSSLLLQWRACCGAAWRLVAPGGASVCCSWARSMLKGRLSFRAPDQARWPGAWEVDGGPADSPIFWTARAGKAGFQASIKSVKPPLPWPAPPDLGRPLLPVLVLARWRSAVLGWCCSPGCGRTGVSASSAAEWPPAAKLPSIQSCCSPA